MSRLKVGDLVTVRNHPYSSKHFVKGEKYPIVSIGPDLITLTSKTGERLLVIPEVIDTVYPQGEEEQISAAEYIARIDPSQELQEAMKTEAVKADQGKAPMSLLDRKWLEVTAQVLAFGAKKYAAHNWRKGMIHSRLLDAAIRHIYAFIDGEDLDPESGLPHLAHASCCLMFATNLFMTRPDLDDRFKEIAK